MLYVLPRAPLYILPSRGTYPIHCKNHETTITCPLDACLLPATSPLYYNYVHTCQYSKKLLGHAKTIIKYAGMEECRSTSTSWLNVQGPISSSVWRGRDKGALRVFTTTKACQRANKRQSQVLKRNVPQVSDVTSVVPSAAVSPFTAPVPTSTPTQLSFLFSQLFNVARCMCNVRYTRVLLDAKSF